MEEDMTDLHATTKKLHSTTQASVWAEEFMRVVVDDTQQGTVDEHTMLVWFANAIEVGRTAGQQWSAERSAELHDAKDREKALLDEVAVLKESLATERNSLTTTARALHTTELLAELDRRMGASDG
jgi:hypothetical protein